MVDNLVVSTTDEHEEEIESRYEATFAVGLVIGLQVTPGAGESRGWLEADRASGLGLVDPGRARGGAVAGARQVGTAASPRADGQAPHGRARTRERDHGSKRTFPLRPDRVAVGCEEKSGGELLLKGVTIWSTNVVTFGLLFWEFDRGGPIRRQAPDAPPRDFQFPQDENPALAEPDRHPRLADYVYISFTNAIAFSPTDAMPLTRRVKMMMLR
jgi:hypothetical protein